MKPIKDWTLEEVKEYCKPRWVCAGCIFYGGGKDCKISVCAPESWNLSESHTITPDELGLLRIYYAAGYRWIARDKDDDLRIYIEKPGKQIQTWDNDGWSNWIPSPLFPVITWSDTEPTSIEDLIKEGENNGV